MVRRPWVVYVNRVANECGPLQVGLNLEKTLVANSFYSFQSRRLLGRSRHWFQSSKVRAARRGSWCAGQPGFDSHQIDRRSGDEGLQVCLGMADRATAPQPTAADGLLMGASAHKRELTALSPCPTPSSCHLWPSVRACTGSLFQPGSHGGFLVVSQFVFEAL